MKELFVYALEPYVGYIDAATIIIATYARWEALISHVVHLIALSLFPFQPHFSNGCRRADGDAALRDGVQSDGDWHQRRKRLRGLNITLGEIVHAVSLLRQFYSSVYVILL